MTQVVRTERDGDVSVIIIDNPPINASSADVRAGLLAAILDLQVDPTRVGAILIGAGTTFVAGSDLKEFGKPIPDPSLPDVIRALEACPKPVVAALHGAALGGGLELALGCDGRVAAVDSVVGLPEVTLGIIPGAGGTQRLPRLTGATTAIRMISSGERMPATTAMAAGIIDRIAEGSLRDAAVAMVRELQGNKRRVGDLPVPAESEPAIAEAATAALRTGKGRPAVREAIEAVRRSLRMPLSEALAAEREAFQALRVSREARALRHLFFAERDAAKVAGLGNAKPQPVGEVGVIGAGTMGAGIAIAALDAGYRVVLVEQEADALERGVARVHDHYTARVKAGKLAPGDADDRRARLAPTMDWASLANSDLIIEAVFEDLGVKQEVFRKLDAVARPGAVMASNTSYLDLDAIAGVTQRPAQVVGLHFFSPANVMRLVEVVRAKHTTPEVLATTLKVARTMRKSPVVSGNAFGFIGNRIYAAYRRQCEFMIEEGASPREVDLALEEFGFSMGPFAVADLSGLDIAWRMRKAQAATRDPASRYVRIPDMLCEIGRLGRKSGAGYYAYPQGGPARQEDPAVTELIARARADSGRAVRPLAAQEIVLRALMAMANEAALVVAAGTCERASDIDVAMVNGYGFPKWEGGPVFWAREQTGRQLAVDQEFLAQCSGNGFVRGDLNLLRSEP